MCNFLLESDKMEKTNSVSFVFIPSICGNFLSFVQSSLDAFYEFTCLE